MSTAEFFEYARGGFTIYTDKDGDRPADIRFVLARYGEAPDLVLEAFWKEHSGDFLVLPIFAYGLPPRRELCTQRSLASALQSVQVESGSALEQKWKEVCDALNVAWPKRLKAA